MTTKHNIDLTIVNDGNSYALRCKLAMQAIAGNSNIYPVYKEDVILPAVKQARKQGDKFSLKDIKEVAIAVMDYDKDHAIECIRDAYKDQPAIQAYGKKWFDSINGNTYHSVTLYIAGHKVYLPMEYGYGEQWKQTAYDWLVKNDFFPDERYDNGMKKCDYSKVEWQGAIDVKKSEL